MAHGKKKWIRDYTGRWKKSNDRSHKDFLADIREYRWFDRMHEACPDCADMRRPYDEHNALVRAEWDRIKRSLVDDGTICEVTEWEWFYGQRVVVRERTPYWQIVQLVNAQRKLQFAHVPWDMRMCASCREKDAWRNWRNSKEPWGKWTRRGIPSWYTRAETRKYRSKMKNIMRKAKYEPDLYETFDAPKRNNQYFW